MSRNCYLLIVCVCLHLHTLVGGVSEHLMPTDHPAKPILDAIVSRSKTSVFHDMQSMVKAGFDYVEPQRVTKVIVTRHKALPGYIIKAYLDTQAYYQGRPEDYYWEKRAEGALLIRKAIGKHHFEHLLKVPHKWIYALPQKKHLALPEGCYAKHYILVEDDMDIVENEENERLWGSPCATKELLDALHTIITEHRFRDCAKPANCPFSKDGRVALVDTQSFYKKKVGYYKLTPYLTPEMQNYWLSLSHVAVKGH